MCAQSSKRSDTVDDKIRRLDAALSRYREQIKKTRPGPAREAIKVRAVKVLKQKRMYCILSPHISFCFQIWNAENPFVALILCRIFH